MLVHIKNPNLKLINKLWQSGYFEEKILTAKLFKKLTKDERLIAYKTLINFSKNVSDWAVCDTLATQALRTVAEEEEIIEFSKRFIKSKNFWQRRLAVVALINLAKQDRYRKEIQRIISLLKDEKEYYVKKAIVWLKKSISN